MGRWPGELFMVYWLLFIVHRLLFIVYDLVMCEDRFAPGLKNYELIDEGGKRAKAKCSCCNRVIAQGYRFDIRLKRSKTLRDERKIHAACISGAIEGKDISILRVQAWQRDAVDEDAFAMLQAVERQLMM